MMEAIPSSEASGLTRATRHHNPEDGILRSHHSVNLKFYGALTGWALLRRCNVFPARYELVSISQKTALFIAIAVKTSNLRAIGLLLQ
jgi:hypothetical protein